MQRKYSIWSNDTKKIKRIVKKNKFILVGSNMGAWIALNQFKYFKSQIKGFVGIGSAPEFLTKLIGRNSQKKKRIVNNRKNFNQNEAMNIITLIIKMGGKIRLHKKINYKINVTMIHGQKDEVVPVNFSRLVLKVFNKAIKKFVVIKNGDHSLSSQNSLKRIVNELNAVIKNVI